MTRSRIAFISLTCMLPVLLGLRHLGTTTVRVYGKVDGKINLMSEGSTPNDNGDVGIAFLWDDSNPGYDPCGYCHTGGQNRQKETYTVAGHRQTYYPRAALSQSEGQRHSWGLSGDYLISRRGVLEYYQKDGTLDMIAPSGSSILKDRSGRPFVLYMPGVPTLQPKSR